MFQVRVGIQTSEGVELFGKEVECMDDAVDLARRLEASGWPIVFIQRPDSGEMGWVWQGGELMDYWDYCDCSKRRA